MHMSNQNLCYIVWSKQLEVLASTWMKIKHLSVKKFMHFKAIYTLNVMTIKLICWKWFKHTHIEFINYFWKIVEWDFIQAEAVSLLMFGCSTWTLMRYFEKRLIGNTQECYVLFGTNPGGSNRQSSCMISTSHFTRHPRWIKHSKNC